MLYACNVKYMKTFYHINLGEDKGWGRVIENQGQIDQ